MAIDLTKLAKELRRAGFPAEWHTDPDEPCLIVPGGLVIYPDGHAVQMEMIEQDEWPAVLIIARHLAGDAARTEEGTPTNKAGAGVGVCRICGADIWISEGDTCKEPCQP